MSWMGSVTSGRCECGQDAHDGAPNSSYAGAARVVIFQPRPLLRLLCPKTKLHYRLITLEAQYTGHNLLTLLRSNYQL